MIVVQSVFVGVLLLFFTYGKVTFIYVHMFYLFISRETNFIIDNVGQTRSGYEYINKPVQYRPQFIGYHNII